MLVSSRRRDQGCVLASFPPYQFRLDWIAERMDEIAFILRQSRNGRKLNRVSRPFLD